MKDNINKSVVFYLLEHLSKGTDLLFEFLPDGGVSFGFFHDIKIASRCLSDALYILKKDMLDVH